MTPYEKAVRDADRKQYGNAPKRKKATDGKSELEVAFDTMLDQLAKDLPKPVGYRGTDKDQFEPIAGRGYRVDRYWPEPFGGPGVVVECEGVGHDRIDWSARNRRTVSTCGYDKDVDKYNAISAAGYTLIRVTMFKLDIEPDDFFRVLRLALRNKGIIE